MNLLYLLAVIISISLWPYLVFRMGALNQKYRRTIVVSFIWGTIAAPSLTVFLFQNILNPIHPPWIHNKLIVSGILVPITEEFFKAAGAILIINFPRFFGFKSQSLRIATVIGGTVGFGFAIAEAIIQGWVQSDLSASINWEVFIGKMATGYLHVATTAIVACGFYMWCVHRRVTGSGLIFLGSVIHITNNSAVALGRPLGIAVFIFAGFMFLVLGIWARDAWNRNRKDGSHGPPAE